VKIPPYSYGFFRLIMIFKGAAQEIDLLKKTIDGGEIRLNFFKKPFKEALDNGQRMTLQEYLDSD